MSDLAKIIRHAERGMLTLRGDLSSAKMKKAVKGATGLGIPAPGKVGGTGDTGVVWMSPDELLVMVPYAAVADTAAQMAKTLGTEHHLIADVSDARSVFTVQGVDAKEVLARVCPVDLHEDSFAVGDFRRTRLAQVAAAFWRHDTGFDVICFRSVGDYAQGVLERAAKGALTGAL